jgi:hypothetical protein
MTNRASIETALQAPYATTVPGIEPHESRLLL